MSNKVENRLVDKFISEVEGYLLDLDEELRNDILLEIRENLEARAEDSKSELALPNAFEYANELRQAAGLRPLSGQDVLSSNIWQQLIVRVKSNRLVSAVRKFAVPFAPLFWIAMGLATFGFIDRFVLGDEGYVGVPSNLEEWILLLLLVLVSMRFSSLKLSAGLKRASRIAIAIALLPIALMLFSISSGVVSAFDEIRSGNFVNRTSGLISDGAVITNIFPYDQNGNLLQNVILIDDLGRPLNSSAEELVTPVDVVLLHGSTESGYLSPKLDAKGNKVWNVYPLKGSLSPNAVGRFSVKPPVPLD